MNLIKERRDSMEDLLFIEVGAAIVAMLLSVIAFFLSRLLKQFDKLNETMIKMDKDISGKIGVIEVQTTDNGKRLAELDPLWDRMRGVESDIAVIKSGCALRSRDCQ